MPHVAHARATRQIRMTAVAPRPSNTVAHYSIASAKFSSNCWSFAQFRNTRSNKEGRKVRWKQPTGTALPANVLLISIQIFCLYCCSFEQQPTTSQQRGKRKWPPRPSNNAIDNNGAPFLDPLPTDGRRSDAGGVCRRRPLDFPKNQ